MSPRASRPRTNGTGPFVTSRGLAVVALVALLLGACVQPKEPKVGITKVEANLVFGVKEPPPPVTPANQNVDEPFPSFDDRLPEIELGGPTINLPPVSSGEVDCPKAPPSAAAKDAADVNITGAPLVGVAKWIRGGTQKPAGAPETLPGQKVTGVEKRLVRNYKKVNDTTSTFETVQVEDAKTAIISTFQVRTNAVNQSTTGGVPVLSGPRAGEPDRGVALVKLERIDAKGEILSSFAPTTGVLYLPLPVASGEQYQSVGVDPKTGQTIVHNATVLGRERVDACGDLVDGWAVEATQSSSNGRGGPASQVSYRYRVAPQYGGMIVFEQLKYTAGTVQNDLIFHLGQLQPDPLPPAPPS